MIQQKSKFLFFIMALLFASAIFCGGFLVCDTISALDESGETVYTIEYRDSLNDYAILDTENPTSVNKNNLPLELVNPVPSGEGRDFDYWGFIEGESGVLDKNASGKFILTKDMAERYSNDGKITIYAYWELKEYNLSFEYVGRSYGNIFPGRGFSNLVLTVETNINLTNTEYVPRCLGHKFLGWYSEIECVNQLTELKNIVSDIKIFGKFEKEDCYITFADESFGFAPIPFRAGLDYAYGSDDNKGLLESDDLIPKKQGYIFEGWYTTEDCKEGTKVGRYTQLLESVTLYAKWKKAPSPAWLYGSLGAFAGIIAGFACWYCVNKRNLKLI